MATSKQDQELVSVLKNTIHAKVLENLDHIVDEAVQVAIVHASKVPEAPAMVLSGRTDISRPKEGGVCAAVWDTLDKMRADEGNVPTLDKVRKVAKRRRWNANNARIEYYRWRAFNGIHGTRPNA